MFWHNHHQATLFNLKIDCILTRTHARARARAHTHTHTHTQTLLVMLHYIALNLIRSILSTIHTAFIHKTMYDFMR